MNDRSFPFSEPRRRTIAPLALLCAIVLAAPSMPPAASRIGRGTIVVARRGPDSITQYRSHDHATSGTGGSMIVAALCLIDRPDRLARAGSATRDRERAGFRAASISSNAFPSPAASGVEVHAALDARMHSLPNGLPTMPRSSTGHAQTTSTPGAIRRATLRRGTLRRMAIAAGAVGGAVGARVAVGAARLVLDAGRLDGAGLGTKRMAAGPGRRGPGSDLVRSWATLEKSMSESPRFDRRRRAGAA